MSWPAKAGHEGRTHAEENDMYIRRLEWPPSRARRRRATWPLSKSLLAVIVICTIFGLQILAVMMCPGGADAYSIVASEGMQFQ